MSNSFGEYLKELRGSKSLREVHRATGVSHTYLSTLEKGFDPRTGNVRKPNPDILKRLADYYETDYKKLMALSGYIDQSPNLNRIGKEIRRIRDKKGISTRELARRSGISQAYLSQLETGKNTRPSPEIVATLSTHLVVSHNYLMMIAGYINETPDVRSEERRVGIE